MSPEEDGICGGGRCIEGTRENVSVKVERGDEFEIYCMFEGDNSGASWCWIEDEPASSIEGRRQDDWRLDLIWAKVILSEDDEIEGAGPKMELGHEVCWETSWLKLEETGWVGVTSWLVWIDPIGLTMASLTWEVVIWLLTLTKVKGTHEKASKDDFALIGELSLNGKVNSSNWTFLETKILLVDNCKHL
jgi:hypothetical protein